MSKALDMYEPYCYEVNLARTGRVAEAIVSLKNKHGCSLESAKAIIDAFLRDSPESHCDALANLALIQMEQDLSQNKPELSRETIRKIIAKRAVARI